MLDVCLKQDIADISAIRAVAGHVDETTLLKNYLFSTRKDEMPQLITTALSSDAWKHSGNIVEYALVVCSILLTEIFMRGIIRPID